MTAVACWLVLSLAMVGTADARVELGGNANENLCSLRAPLIERSRTTWVRGMLPFAEFYGGKRNLVGDEPLRTLKAAADAGRKVILTLKWDLKENRWRVPARGSDERQRWLNWVDQALAAMSGRITILVVTNEVFVDTMRADLNPSPAGTIPYLDFLQELVVHVRARNLRAADGRPLPIFLGGFNRLQEPGMQADPALQAMLSWARSFPQVDGIDVHLHARSISDMAAALRFARSRMGSKPIIVTEFSTVLAYREHLDDTLGTGEKGRQFAQRYSLDPATTVFAYINKALADPVPEDQWHAFLASRDWFDPQVVSKAAGLMEGYGVTVATYAFSEAQRCGNNPGPRRFRLKPGVPPWLLNPLFVGSVAETRNPSVEATNYGVFDDYVRWQGGASPVPAPSATKQAVPPPSSAARKRAVGRPDPAGQRAR